MSADFVLGIVTLAESLTANRAFLSDDEARTALRATAASLPDAELARFKGAAWNRVETYTGRLFGNRAYSERWTLTTASRVLPGAPWRMSSVTVDTWSLWTQADGWQAQTAPVLVTPELYELSAGEWRAQGSIGAATAPAEVTEAVVRIMAYLFDVDPASEMSHGDLVRRSGAASLLGPHCIRGAS